MLSTPILDSYREKAKPTGKSVLLFSGGMDSIIFTKLLNPDILLHIPIGGKYSGIEKDIILKIQKSHYIKCVDPEKIIILDDTINLGKFERKGDFIIPNRNAHLILLASNFGETIYLCCVSGDQRCLDKDKPFFLLVENLLNHMHSEQSWTYKKEFKILNPYINYTKTELVKMFLEAGGDPNDILNSYSCYGCDDKHCGSCKTCARKFVALVNNGILTKSDGKSYFKNDPMKAEWVWELLPLMKEGGYRGREDADFVKVYG